MELVEGAQASRIRKIALCGALALAAGLAAPSPSGAVVTLGSSLSGPGNVSFGCSLSPCTLSQTALPGRTTESPVNGTVTVWRTRNNTAAISPAQLRVIRPLGATVLFVSTGAAETIPATGDVIHTFTTAQGISIGDRIGINQDGGIENVRGQTLVSGASLGNFNPAPADGATVPAGVPGPNFEILLNADVEPTNTFTASKPKALKNGKAKLTVTLPNAGSVVVGGGGSASSAGAEASAKKALVKSSTTAVAAPGELPLKLKPTKGTKKRLKEKGKAKGSVSLTFTPSFGTAFTKTIKVKLQLK